jgi:hypothetical protein
MQTLPFLKKNPSYIKLDEFCRPGGRDKLYPTIR